VSRLAYVDASAMVKLAVPEAESPGMLRWYAEAERVVTSRIGIVEIRRAAARHTHDPEQLRLLVRSMEIVELSREIADRASSVAPSILRALDAIHLATALALGGEVDAFVTYDDRLASAARAVGLPVVRPA